MSRQAHSQITGRIVTFITLLSLFVSASLVAASSNQQDTLSELVYGQTVDNRIDSAQPSVFYAFNAAQGDIVTITMIVTDGELDPFIILNTADRTPLATDDNSGGGANARLSLVIPAAGQYIIQATHAGGVPPENGGAFSLNLTAAVDSGTTAAPAVESTAVAAPATTASDARLVKLDPGSTVQGVLTSDIALRFYWFTAQEGDQITLTPEQMSNFQPLLTLYDAAFNEIGQVADASPLNVTLSQTGIFFVTVSPTSSDNASGDYGFSFGYFPNPVTTGNFLPITYGASQGGTIDNTISAATYRFEGTAGDTITITMNRTGGDLNSYLYLLDNTGQLLYEDNDSGGANGDAQITFTLPESANYLIVATRLGQTQGTTSGSYILALQSDSAPPIAEATPEPVLPAEYANLPQISYGETIEGELSDAKYVDFYVFFGTTGDTITAEMRSPTIDEPLGLDPLLILLDSERIPLAENDDIVDGVERESQITFTLPSTSYYALVATRFEQETGTTSGPYTLTLNGSDDQSISTTLIDPDVLLVERLNTVALETDTPQQATFRAGASLYSFSALEDELITIAATADEDPNTVLILADENLNEIVSDSTGTLSNVVIPKSGIFVLFVAPQFDPASPTDGDYILSLTQTTEASTPEPVIAETRSLVYGDVVNGSIDDVISSQSYTFNGTMGERVRITMEATPGSELDCYLQLQDANGEIVDANDDIDPGVVRDSQLVIDLQADGTYTIVASRFVGGDEPTTTGTFRLTLELLDENAVTGVSSLTTPIAYGQTEVDELNDDQYLLFYVFDGTAGDIITIEVDHLSGNLDSVLHLYRSEGESWVPIASNDDSLTGGTYAPLLSDITLPQTGKYLIALNRYGMENETTFGTFALTVTQSP